MARPNRLGLIIPLLRTEKLALRAFNKEVSFLTGTCKDLRRARVNALYNLKRNDDTVTELASAFRSLYPHWFSNGRGTLADGDVNDCAKVCLDVIGKLNKVSGHHFMDIAKLFDLSGNNAVATGRRPLASAADRVIAKRTRTRVRRINCRYHPDKTAVAGELCSRCYNRWNALVGKNVRIEDYPGLAVEAIMNLPRPTKNNPLYIQAREIGKKYKELEEANANSIPA